MRISFSHVWPRARAAATGAAVAGSLGAVCGTARAQAPAAAAAVGTGADWPLYNGTLAGERYSRLAEIDTGNVARLRRVCRFDTGEVGAFQTGPVAVDGTLYLTTDTVTYAVDGATCALRWRSARPYSPPSALKVNRGAAYASTPDGPVLVRGTGDAHVIALDARTGRRLWDVPIGDPALGETVPASPVVWDGTVYVGQAGGDNFGVTGRIYALDVRTGATRWLFHAVPPNDPSTPPPGAPSAMTAEVARADRVARATWPAPTPSSPRTGGATWTSYAVDTAAGLLYVPGGNPAPDFAKPARPGDNLFASALVALDARTGALRGYVQLVRDDFHDWDVAAAPALATTAAGRRVAAVAPKDGHLYGVDRDALTAAATAAVAGGRDALPLSADRSAVRYRVPVTTQRNVTAPMTAAGTRFCPGTQGGAEYNGPAYHPATNAFYVGTVDWCSTVRLATAAQLAQGKAGQPWSGSAEAGEYAFGHFDPKARWRGWVTAVDADRGTVRWRHATAAPAVAAVTATAGGLVFAGDLSGAVVALDAATGRVRWRTSTGQPVGGGLITYEAGGRQRVAVASGMTAKIWQTQASSAALLVYALGPEQRPGAPTERARPGWRTAPPRPARPGPRAGRRGTRPPPNA